MSMLGWTCDGLWPSTWCADCPGVATCLRATVQWLHRERREAAQGVDPHLDACPSGADPRGGPGGSPRRAL
eukprot:15443894-Alexandrium_andersonii.AAC.1